MAVFDLGAYIKEKRKEKKLTQKQVSEITGLAKSTISGIESGYTAPSVESMAALAMALSIDLNVMYGLKRAERSLNCDGLTERQIAVIQQTIEEFRDQNSKNGLSQIQ